MLLLAEHQQQHLLDAIQLPNEHAQLDDQLMKYSDFLEEQRRKSAELFEQSVKRIDDSLLENSSQVENVLSGFVEKLEEKDRKTISFILDVADPILGIAIDIAKRNWIRKRSEVNCLPFFRTLLPFCYRNE